MMLWLSSLWFNIVFYGTNVFMALLLMWTMLISRKATVWGVHVWLSAVDWVENHLGGIKHVVIGREYIPEGPCIIAAKHQSEWETFKLHLLLNDPSIVLKSELLRIPVIGWYMMRVGSIPIDRNTRGRALTEMLEASRKAVAEGRPIAIFPEGTRARPGENPPYKAGIGFLYEELNIPVVPMALNSGLLWPAESFIKKRGTITIEFLPLIPAGLSREEMMQRLRDTLEPATARLVNLNPS